MVGQLEMIHDVVTGERSVAMINMTFGCVQCAKAKAVIEEVKADFLDMQTHLGVTEHPEVLQKSQMMSDLGHRHRWRGGHH